MAQDQAAVHYRVGVDTGGTHTDGFIAASDGREWQVKVETTPHDLTVGFLHCLEEAAGAIGAPSYDAFLRQCSLIRFSTTLGTNAVLEGKAARVGIVTSVGWEDAAKAATEGFVEADLVVGLAEQAPPEAVAAAVRQLLTRGARVIAVSLAGAWADPALERRVQAIANTLYPSHHLGAVTVLLSSDLTNAEDFGPRTALTAVNAAVHPVMARALYRAEDELRRHGYRNPLWIVHANGGSAKVAKTRAVDTYNSGPAAGIYAAARLAALRGWESVVTMDVGGTSTDVGLVRQGTVPYREAAVIAGQPIALPVVAVHPVAGGGGSIVRASGGSLSIGPDSAGSVPGPACYGIGGEEPTVTDAALVAGYLHPARFLRGQRRLDPTLAARALSERLAASGENAALIAQVVLERFAQQVAQALEQVVVPGAVLLAYGGGSGLVAARVAQLAGIGTVYVPYTTAAFCAYGAATMPVTHVYDHLWSDAGSPNQADAVFNQMAERARLDMAGEGVPAEAVRLERLWGAQEDGGMVRFEPWEGARVRGAGVLRLRATATGDAWETGELGRGVTRETTWLGHRDVTWQGHRYQTPVVAGMAPGDRREGPLLVEGEWATLWVPPGCRIAAEDLFYRLEVR
ncbi:MAG: hydantoinase/oxoprolinase family protein [Firmicutes bacterium]|nr:hydantoinase/oxoprolinase family protein [Alicyclobacillaceae bacterium]MCL6498384.1 hydantoinase/oxoprolinase family protein [Bacillota bacterium]